jgi:hypothetical protein
MNAKLTMTTKKTPQPNVFANVVSFEIFVMVP